MNNRVCKTKFVAGRIVRNFVLPTLAILASFTILIIALISVGMWFEGLSTDMQKLVRTVFYTAVFGPVFLLVILALALSAKEGLEQAGRDAEKECA